MPAVGHQVGQEDAALTAAKDGIRLLGDAEAPAGPEGDVNLEMSKEISDLPVRTPRRGLILGFWAGL